MNTTPGKKQNRTLVISPPTFHSQPLFGAAFLFVHDLISLRKGSREAVVLWEVARTQYATNCPVGLRGAPSEALTIQRAYIDPTIDPVRAVGIVAARSCLRHH
jgi:hypothetical protein